MSNTTDSQTRKNDEYADEQLARNKQYFNEQISKTKEQINDQVDGAKEQFNDQVNRMVDFQSGGFVPMQMFGNLAVEMFDTLTRKNVAVMGDLFNYTLKQAHVPMAGDYVTEMMNARSEETRAFGELLGTRANEYAQIANDFGSRAKDAADDVTDDAESKSRAKSKSKSA